MRSNNRRRVSPQRRRRYSGGARGGFRKPKPLDVSLLINRVDHQEVVETAKEQVGEPFSTLTLPGSLHETIKKKGYERMTPIQAQAIPLVMQQKDVLGIANTGTGKTGAFLIPLLSRLILGERRKVLIMAPTRELALQIQSEFLGLRGQEKIYSTLCIGGTSMNRQIADLRRSYQVLIGTPGRVKDMMEQSFLDMSSFGVVVLDEVDRMLDMGFVHDMRAILSELPTSRQSLYFSATINPQVEALIREFSGAYESVSVRMHNTAATIDQDIVPYQSSGQKFDLLIDLLMQKETEKVLIFGRTKHGVRRLADTLSKKGYKSDSIHGNKTQGQRQRALMRFRRNEVWILVATDVASRGLDIDDVTHVINYDMPDSYDDYVHRIGRTGRAKQYGKALTFVEV